MRLNRKPVVPDLDRRGAHIDIPIKHTCQLPKSRPVDRRRVNILIPEGKMTKVMFESWVHEALIRRGIKLDPGGTWIRCPGMTSAASVTDEQLHWLNDYFNRSHQRRQNEINNRLRLQWVKNFCDVTRTLDDSGSDAPWPFVGIFWIRLHGVVVDLRSDVAKLRKFVSDVGWEKGCSGDACLPVQMHDAIVRIISTLTEDELIYADYRRHTEAHVTQRSYDLRWAKGKSGTTIGDRRGIPALNNKEFNIDELDAAHDRVFRAHHLSDTAIAIAFARRLREPAASLLMVAEEFYSSEPDGSGPAMELWV